METAEQLTISVKIIPSDSVQWKKPTKQKIKPRYWRKKLFLEAQTPNDEQVLH